MTTTRLIREANLTFHLGMPHAKVTEQLARLIAIAQKEEREACAKICADKAAEYLARSVRKQHSHGAGLGALVCEKAILERTNMG